VLPRPLVPPCWAIVALLQMSSGRVFGLDENVIVRGLTAGAASIPSTPTEVSLLSYNIQTRPILDDAKEKLPKISPRLKGYDVVAIQECFQRHDLLWAGTDYPNRVYFGRPSAPWKVANSGLSVLTRLPMSAVEMIHYRHVGELQNMLASKGALMVRLHVGRAAIDFYDTHMEAGDTDAAQRARLGQAAELVAFVKSNSPPSHAVILAGDFNMGPFRAGKGWRDYRPNHYASEKDMKSRTSAFKHVREVLALRDMLDELFGPVNDDIERYLFRNGTGCHLEPLACQRDNVNFRREDGSSLSDGSPLVARFRVTTRNVLP